LTSYWIFIEHGETAARRLGPKRGGIPNELLWISMFVEDHLVIGAHFSAVSVIFNRKWKRHSIGGNDDRREDAVGLEGHSRKDECKEGALRGDSADGDCGRKESRGSPTIAPSHMHLQIMHLLSTFSWRSPHILQPFYGSTQQRLTAQIG
jgi:hypothetical protein